VVAQGDEIHPVPLDPRCQLVLQIQEEPRGVPAVGMMDDAEEMRLVVVEEILDILKREHLARRGNDYIWDGMLRAPHWEHVRVHDGVVAGDSEILVDGLAAEAIRLFLEDCDVGVGELAPGLE